MIVGICESGVFVHCAVYLWHTTHENYDVVHIVSPRLLITFAVWPCQLLGMLFVLIIPNECLPDAHLASHILHSTFTESILYNCVVYYLVRSDKTESKIMLSMMSTYCDTHRTGLSHNAYIQFGCVRTIYRFRSLDSKQKISCLSGVCFLFTRHCLNCHTGPTFPPIHCTVNTCRQLCIHLSDTPIVLCIVL